MARQKAHRLRSVVAVLAVVAIVIPGLTAAIITRMTLFPSWYDPGSPSQGLTSFAGTRVGEKVLAGIHHDPLSDLGIPFEEVTFSTQGSATLRGWFIAGSPAATAGVIAVHGAGMDRRQFLRHLPVLHDEGYPVLLFDCREHGISDGNRRGISLGRREHEDIIAAVAYMRRRQISRLAVLGTSLGGASAILAAALEPQIQAVIAENPYASLSRMIDESLMARGPLLSALAPVVATMLRWRTDALSLPEPIDVVDRISPRPLLLMHGTEDQFIPHAHSEALYARAQEPKSLWLAEGARHVVLYNRYPKEWKTRVTGFLRTWLPYRSDAPLSPL